MSHESHVFLSGIGAERQTAEGSYTYGSRGQENVVYKNGFGSILKCEAIWRMNSDS